MSEAPQSHGAGGGRVAGIATLVVTGLILLAALLPAVLFAIAFYAVGRLFLTRRHWVVLGLASLVGFILTFKDSFATYFLWLPRLIGQGDAVESWFHVRMVLPAFYLPPISILLFGMALASIYGMILGGGMGTIKPAEIAKAMRGKKPLVSGEDIVPENHKAIRERLIRKAPPLDLIPKPGQTKAGGRKVNPKNREFPLGRDKKGRVAFLSEKDIKTHAMVLGSTGSGKTELIKWLIGAMTDMGMDGCVLDLKEDTTRGGLRDFCRAIAADKDLPYQEVALSDTEGRWWFNALAGMSADEAADALFSSQEFDDSFHQSLNRKAAGQSLQLLYHVHRLFPDQYPAPSIYTLGNFLEKDMFAAAKPLLAQVSQVEGHDVTRDRYGALLKSDETLKKEGQTFGLRLTNLYDSEAGRHVLRAGRTSDGHEREQLDVTQPGVVYVGLSSLSQPETAETLSAAVLQRFNVFAGQIASGRIESTGRDRYVIIDEANRVDHLVLQNLLSRARSAGLRVFIATQSGLDFEDDFEMLAQNTGLMLTMLQTSPESAKLAAEFIGTGTKTQVNQSYKDGVLSDQGSLSSKVDYEVDPQVLRRFDSGELVVRTASRKTWVQVPMRTKELEAYAAEGYPRPTP